MQHAVRRNAYVHSAGRTDFQTGARHGNADTDAEWGALSNGLGG